MAGKIQPAKTELDGKKYHYNNYDDMFELYWDKELSAKKIAKLFDKGTRTILHSLERLKIPRRKPMHKRDISGEKNPMWDGGTKILKGGYIGIYQPNHPFSNSQGYYPEHRLNIEEKIGRYLKPTEIVHHKNKDRKDNRPENLELFKSNSAHAKHENQYRKRDKKGRFR
jgi:hypothetical protein